MAVAVGSFLVASGSTDGASITGLGFRPTAALFVSNGFSHTTDTTFAQSMSYGLGVASQSLGANARFFGATSQNGAAAAVEDKRNQGSRSFARLVVGGAGIDGISQVTSWDADGFTYQNPNAYGTAMHVHYLAWRARRSDVGTFNEPGAIGAQSITEPGFTPDVVFLIGSRGAQNTASVHSNFSFGFAFGSDNYVSSVMGADGADPTNTGHYFFKGESIALSDNNTGSMQARASVTGFTGSGFDLNWAEVISTDNVIAYLALGGLDVAVGDTTTSTDTSNQTVSGVGFQPEGGLMMAGKQLGFETQDTPENNIDFNIGFFTSPTNRRASSFWNQDNVANTQVAGSQESDQVLTAISTSEAQASTADIVSIDADGFTWKMDSVEANTRPLVWAVFKEKPTVGNQVIFVG